MLKRLLIRQALLVSRFPGFEPSVSGTLHIPTLKPTLLRGVFRCELFAGTDVNIFLRLRKRKGFLSSVADEPSPGRPEGGRLGA